jgi:hypothetical protein
VLLFLDATIFGAPFLYVAYRAFRGADEDADPANNGPSSGGTMPRAMSLSSEAIDIASWW